MRNKLSNAITILGAGLYSDYATVHCCQLRLLLGPPVLLDKTSTLLIPPKKTQLGALSRSKE
jgi:hypothetical protein